MGIHLHPADVDPESLADLVADCRALRGAVPAVPGSVRGPGGGPAGPLVGPGRPASPPARPWTIGEDARALVAGLPDYGS